MYIRSTKEGFTALLGLFPADNFEMSAMQFFKMKQIEKAGTVFLLIEISTKIQKAIANQKKKIDITPAEACCMLAWFGYIPPMRCEFDLHTVRTLSADLHLQLTNYKRKF